MNFDVPDHDGAIRFYDGDYPSLEIDGARAGDVIRLERMGILGDIAHYKEWAARVGGPILEIGCGTGRLTIPLARMGLAVTAVDGSRAMLAQLEAKLERESPEIRAHVHIVEADARHLDLGPARFPLVLVPFNVLMLIPDFNDERRALAAAAAHLAEGGRLGLDVMNPMTLPIDAEPHPSPSHPRRTPGGDGTYVKNSLCDALDSNQCQRVHGWYDELREGGEVIPHPFSFRWRLIFRFELELMLAEAGLALDTLAGDFDGEEWTLESRRIVVTATRSQAATPA